MNLFRAAQSMVRRAAIDRDERAYSREYRRSAVLSYPPRQVTIGITSACGNQCVFCAYHSRDAKHGASRVYDLPFQLSLGDFSRAVDLCFESRVPQVHICATGEPFLHKDVLSMVDYVIKKYGKASIQTSFPKAIFDRRNCLQEIVSRGSRIEHITTDVLSGDPATHNDMKQGSKYEDIMDAMEYLSQKTAIRFAVHCVLTKFNYEHLEQLVEDIARRKIRGHLEIVNLHPYEFNQFTMSDAVYTLADTAIAEHLERTARLGRQRGVPVSVPRAADAPGGFCGSFWSRFQIWPVQGIDARRYAENVVIGACRAVVLGELRSMGYLFDYSSIMDLWNNEAFVGVRQGLLDGRYPSSMCEGCQNFSRR